MPAISEQSERAIKEFLAFWWADLTWKAHETVAGAQLPPQTPDQLYDQLLGLTLRDIAAAAEGLLPDERKGEAYEACQQLAEWMWARPGMPSAYTIPWQEWAATPVGNLVLRAMLWLEGDELITMSEAAKLSRRRLQTISDMVARGTLTGYRDPDEPNPTKATRVRRSDVERLAQKRKKQ